MFVIDGVKQGIETVKALNIGKFLGKTVTVLAANKLPIVIATTIMWTSPLYGTALTISAIAIIFFIYRRNQGPVPSPIYDDSIDRMGLLKIVLTGYVGILCAEFINPSSVVLAVVAAVAVIFYIPKSDANATPAPVYGKLVAPSDLYDVFPKKNMVSDAVLEIFSKLDYKDFQRCCVVSRAWNRLGNDPYLSKSIIFKMFNPLHWNDSFNVDILTKEEAEETFKSLPDNINAILKSPSKGFPGKRIIDKHILVWVTSTTTNNFGKLIKQKAEFSGNPTGYELFTTQWVQKEVGDIAIESGWRLMAMDVLPDSQNKSYISQKGMTESLNGICQNGWRVPKVGETVICVYAHYFRSGERLLSNTSTRCQDSVDRFYKAQVGLFADSGVAISDSPSISGRDYLGVAPIWQL